MCSRRTAGSIPGNRAFSPIRQNTVRAVIFHSAGAADACGNQCQRGRRYRGTCRDGAEIEPDDAVPRVGQIHHNLGAVIRIRRTALHIGIARGRKTLRFRKGARNAPGGNEQSSHQQTAPPHITPPLGAARFPCAPKNTPSPSPSPPQWGAATSRNNHRRPSPWPA